MIDPLIDPLIAPFARIQHCWWGGARSGKTGQTGFTWKTTEVETKVDTQEDTQVERKEERKVEGTNGDVCNGVI